MKNTLSPLDAAINIQRTYRGFFSRKKTNNYGASEGKEIEVYLPCGYKNEHTQQINYYMVGNFKEPIAVSELFSLHIEVMNFTPHKVKILEIVTVPYKKPGTTNTNWRYSEEQIDKAVSDFLMLLEEFTLEAAKQEQAMAHISLEELMGRYNKNSRYPLKWDKEIEYSISQYLLDGVKFGFVFEKNNKPRFDANDTPRTSAAADIVKNDDYCSGKLLVHVQKTFSMPVECYNPDYLAREKNPDLHNKEQQLEILNEAHRKAQAFITAHPLPATANRARILGLLTMSTELCLTVVHALTYEGLHEKADRPVLSTRHILHYIKKNICNEDELQWFSRIFKSHYKDIKSILGVDEYESDYASKGNGYPFTEVTTNFRYNVIFDLFGDYTNQKKFTSEDKDNPLPLLEIKTMHEHGMSSWENLFFSHYTLSGRTQLALQKVRNESNRVVLHPLFEARRIGLFTVEEFGQGKSRISLPEQDEMCFRL